MENDNQFYLYGMHPVTDAVRQGRKFERILFRKGLEGEQFRALLDEVTQRGIPYQFVPGEKMNRIVKGAHQGVVAYLAQIDYVSFEEMVEGALSRKATDHSGRTAVQTALRKCQPAQYPDREQVAAPQEGQHDPKHRKY